MVRNWSLDLFKRRRGEWVKIVKEIGIQTLSSLPAPILEPAPTEEELAKIERDKGKLKIKKKKHRGKNEGPPVDPTKSAIQLARERFAKNKMVNAGAKNNKGTGANAGLVVGEK